MSDDTLTVSVTMPGATADTSEELTVSFPRFTPPDPKSKLTPEAVTLIVKTVLAGNFVAVGARVARCHPDTVSRWQVQGRADLAADLVTPFSILEECVQEAETQFQAWALKMALLGMPRDPRLALDLLGRRFRAWSNKGQVEVSGQVDFFAQLKAFSETPDKYGDAIIYGPNNTMLGSEEVMSAAAALLPGVIDDATADTDAWSAE